jgi:hypothetical protein
MPAREGPCRKLHWATRSRSAWNISGIARKSAAHSAIKVNRRFRFSAQSGMSYWQSKTGAQLLSSGKHQAIW